MRINMEVVTLEDCVQNYQLKNKIAVLNDGKLIKFMEVERNGK